MKLPATRKAISIFFAIISLASTSRSTVTTRPSAISVPVRTSWYGYDGLWSPISIRVGTPPQWIDVFVSTASQETWVIGPGGCDGTFKCQEERGGNLFEANESSTWEGQGAFALGLDPQLGFSGDGTYGFDDVAFSDQISVPSQIVGVINSTDYWLGYFGLGVEPTNFTSTDKPTFLDSMVQNQSLIPSHSYGYTAGAHYRLKGVPSSLTLGGFDSSRFESNNLSFELDAAQSPVVAVTEIVAHALPSTSDVATGWINDSMTLLTPSDAVLFTIDSSTPFLWLPDLELYTFGVGPSQHDALISWNLTFQFTLADLPGSSSFVSVSLPFAAFDLELSYPYPGLNATQTSAPTKYFPLRKAANATQYTLGRSFLQETYLIVDYERNNFSISQALFLPDALQDFSLIDITRPENSTFTGPVIHETPRLTRADIAGVSVGVAVASVLLIVIVYLSFRLRQDRTNEGYIRNTDDGVWESKRKRQNSKIIRWILCLPKCQTPTEIGDSTRFPIDASNAKGISELPTSKETQSELEGSTTEIPSYQEAYRTLGVKAVFAIGHNPEKPVELPYHSSARGFFEPTLAPKLQTAAPARTSTEHDDLGHRIRQDSRTTAGVSSPSNTPSKRSSKQSSPMFVVSPVSPREISPGYSSLDNLSRRGAWYLPDSLGRDVSLAKAAPTSNPAAGSEKSEGSGVSTITTQIRQSITQGFRPDLPTSHDATMSDNSGISGIGNIPTITNQTNQRVSRGCNWPSPQAEKNEEFARSPPCSTCVSGRSES